MDQTVEFFNFFILMIFSQAFFKCKPPVIVLLLLSVFFFFFQVSTDLKSSAKAGTKTQLDTANFGVIPFIKLQNGT